MNIEIYSEKFFEDIKHITEDGIEYWLARELQEILEYSKWGNFLNVIEKAKTSVEATNIKVSDHFADVGKTIKMPKGAEKIIPDIMLTRYACYLIVQNGDPRKKMIALGQQYFAVQTRKQEIIEKDFEELTEDERRILLRSDVRGFNKKLAKAAQDCGVENFAKFQNFGYRGLYGGETAADIKARKKLNNYYKYKKPCIKYFVINAELFYFDYFSIIIFSLLFLQYQFLFLEDHFVLRNLVYF